MFSLGHSFHQKCLNELARSLTHVNREAKEKVGGKKWRELVALKVPPCFEFVYVS